MLSFVDLAFKLCGTFKSFLDFFVLMLFGFLSFRVLLNLSCDLFTLQRFWSWTRLMNLMYSLCFLFCFCCCFSSSEFLVLVVCFVRFLSLSCRALMFSCSVRCTHFDSLADLNSCSNYSATANRCLVKWKQCFVP